MTIKDYISISRQGIFVAGKPADKYNGQPIANVDYISKLFKYQDLKDISEIRALQSDTRGTVFEPGNPNPSKTGQYVWIQVVTKYGTSPWFFRVDNGNLKNIASLCAFQCAWTLGQYPNWVNRLVNAAKAENIAQKAQNTVVNGVYTR